MMDWLRADPVRALAALAVLIVATVGLLQLTPPCVEWREWKRSKQGRGIHTTELLIPPFFCIGSRQL